MKLMTYNILDGAEATLPTVIEVINKEQPDYLTINEANTFAKNNNSILNEIGEKTNLPYVHVALSGEYDYHVAVLSKYPFKELREIKPLMRACIVAVVDTELGPISIASIHLTPYSEDLRLPEINLIINSQKDYENRILIGDMNSLSKNDGYDEDMISHFNETQINKFTTDNHLRFDVIDTILSSKYLDTALLFGKANEYTVPTPANKDKSHANMRLDYIFVSDSLRNNVKDYSVVKNDLTDRASDHYPVIVKLE